MVLERVDLSPLTIPQDGRRAGIRVADANFRTPARMWLTCPMPAGKLLDQLLSLLANSEPAEFIFSVATNTGPMTISFEGSICSIEPKRHPRWKTSRAEIGFNVTETLDMQHIELLQ